MVPLLIYIIITSFTPGPNNISVASYSLNLGYWKTLRYMLGITSGFFVMMFAAGLFTEIISTTFPRFESILRFIGAGYVLWLAYSIFKTSENKSQKKLYSAKFLNGFLLQVVNPKVILYGSSIYVGFLYPLINNILSLIIASLLLSVVCFIAISTWASFGMGIKRVVKNEKTINNLFVIRGMFR